MLGGSRTRCPAGGLASLEHLVHVRCLGGKVVDALVQVAVAVAIKMPGSAANILGLASSRKQHSTKVAGGGGAGTDAGAAAAAFADEQIGEPGGGGLGHVERGRVNDDVGSVSGMRIVFG